MTRKSLNHFNCSIAKTLDIIGDKWSMMIIRDAFFGVSSFSGFQTSLGIARNILSERLTHLVETGILEKRRTRPGVERFSYHLSERGRALMPLLVDLMQWGNTWITGQDNAPMILIERETGEPIQEMSIRSQDGRILSMPEIGVTLGPGASAENKAAMTARKAKDAARKASGKA